MEEMEEERGGGVELHRRDCTSSERDRKILIDPALPGHRGTVGSQQIFLAVYRGTEVHALVYSVSRRRAWIGCTGETSSCQVIDPCNYTLQQQQVNVHCAVQTKMYQRGSSSCDVSPHDH